MQAHVHGQQPRLYLAGVGHVVLGKITQCPRALISPRVKVTAECWSAQPRTACRSSPASKPIQMPFHPERGRQALKSNVEDYFVALVSQMRGHPLSRPWDRMCGKKRPGAQVSRKRLGARLSSFEIFIRDCKRCRDAASSPYPNRTSVHTRNGGDCAPFDGETPSAPEAKSLSACTLEQGPITH